MKEDKTLEKQESATSNNADTSSQERIVALETMLVKTQADFENYRKRTDKQMLDWSESAKEKTIKSVLPFVDELNLALKSLRSDEKLVASGVLKGLEMLERNFIKMLEKNGVTKIDSSKEFDPALHEAVAQIESKDYNPGEIVETIKSGFKMNDKVIQHSQVVVCK